ncbi:MAG: fibrobacter succinogenes major paralogous domain-containing protein [Chitinispirillales bacterium]|jgi:uncharacterized protein (TIGR02145 family)|nr:fibrobacter succinogenes major paralogous domain-containing protein [Chitinispirillales bacterium]
MRNLILTTAAVAAAICLAGCSKKALVSFTDGRDGQKYKTVKIGQQTWMAKNLNYQTDGGSWCYEDKANNCKKYGRLYDWKTATTVCPKGWKLPSRENWDKLVATAGGFEIAGKKLKSKSGWKNRNDWSTVNGTDNYGFSALPGGDRRSDGYFGNVGNFGYWWTATEYDAYYRHMYYDDDAVYEGNSDKSYGFSVRCVKE